MYDRTARMTSSGCLLEPYCRGPLSLYSSADTVLRLLETRLAPNVTIVFDELVNYPEFLEGEMRALLELQRRSGRTVRVIHTAAATVLRSKKENLEALRQTGEEMPHTGRYQQAVAVQLF